MSYDNLACNWCGKSNFKTRAGLTQHLRREGPCHDKEYGIEDKKLPSLSTSSTQFMAFTDIVRHKSRLEYLKEDVVGKNFDLTYHGGKMVACRDSYALDHENYDVENDFDFDVGGNNSDQDDSLADAAILQNFREFVKKAEADNYFLSIPEQRAVRLMLKLRQSTASLATYDSIMEWHLRESGLLREGANLSSSTEFISSKKLFSALYKRYNMCGNVSIPRELVLPSSGAKVKIVTNKTEWCFQSLLTDPRLKSEDFLFHGDNPFAGPPEEGCYGDINTGLAYRKTYEKLIKYPDRQVLCPVIMYLDGAETGQFVSLPITAFKMTLGIFNRKARERWYMWRTLGYVPKIPKDASSSGQKLHESGHVDALMTYQDRVSGEGKESSDVPRAQDRHAVLEVILQDYIKLQEHGFQWNLRYKGKSYSVEFVLYVHFIKCDTDEADRLCGAYTSRGKGVGQLCRYCCCPTNESDNPLGHNYERKTVSMIQKLVNRNDDDELKSYSQHPMTNTLHQIRFGLHNKCGVHGSCPMEILHHLHLGIFKMVRDCFFDLLGKDSKVAGRINSLAREYGQLLSRQSDRDMPKTKFNDGITKGKLQASENVGILLLLMVVLSSSLGRSYALEKLTPEQIDNWIELLCTLLEWDRWLQSERLDRKMVLRARKKHQVIMAMIKNVLKRTKGMGLKTNKFHAILHLVEDITFFGVPLNMDTAQDESGHKPGKKAAKLVQKRRQTFDLGVSNRLNEQHLLALAAEEIEHDNAIWHYFADFYDHRIAHKSDVERAKKPIGGGHFVLGEADTFDESVPVLKDHSRKTKDSHPIKVEQPFVLFLDELQKKVANFGVSHLPVRTSYTTETGQIYRAASRYLGDVWRDWAWVDWGGNYGIQLAKIWGFVDLSDIEPKSNIEFGGLDVVDPGIYAIVENAEMQKDITSRQRQQKLASRTQLSATIQRTSGVLELLVPVIKEVGRIENKRVVDLKFYLLNVDWIHAPAAVVPDIGGDPHGYWLLRKRSQWRQLFEDWLDSPYEDLGVFED